MKVFCLGFLGLLLSINCYAKNSDGRFELVQLGEMRADQFLLDTKTGRVWKRLCLIPGGTTGCHTEYWAQQDVAGITANEHQILKRAAAEEAALKAPLPAPGIPGQSEK